MRWFWVVDCDNTVPDPLVIDSHDFGEIDEDALRSGRRVVGWISFAWLRATKAEDDGIPDDVLQNHLGVPVYSRRLRVALEGAGIGGLEFLPVRVFRPNGEEVNGFSVGNVVERRAALDIAASDVDVFPSDYFLPERRGSVRAVRKPVLREQELRGCDVIRLDEFPPSIYVSERFKDAFERGGFTGYSFHEVETV